MSAATAAATAAATNSATVAIPAVRAVAAAVVVSVIAPESECATGQRFVRYWMHGQHLLADGQKMAKSEGNAYTLADLTARGFSPAAFRYLCAT